MSVRFTDCVGCGRTTAMIVLIGCTAGPPKAEELIGSSEAALSCFSNDTTTRVSVSSSGTQAASGFEAPALSANDRFVAFQSPADNLVAGDTNGVDDIFVRDRIAVQTSRESVSSSGTQANGPSANPAISADGRYVLFASIASNLVPGDTNGSFDIFRRDRTTGQTIRVSLASGGAQANAGSSAPSVSADGRFVAFESDASNLVPGDANGRRDIFVRDVAAGQTIRVSVSNGGVESDFNSFSPAISANGLFVAFESFGTNLITPDTNNTNDIFVFDIAAGQISRVNVSTAGVQANLESGRPSLTADGRIVVFDSRAANLVANDTNNTFDVFLRDRQAGQTTRVSLASNGAQLENDSSTARVNADGRFIAFTSNDANLGPGDTNGQLDIFLRDRQTNQTIPVSVSTAGQFGDRGAVNPSISADGRTVAFISSSTNLVAGDTNNAFDAFVHTVLPPIQAWAPGIVFSTGAFATFNESTFQCLQSHTSQSGWEPPNATSLWVIPTPCGVTAWAIHTAYVVGSLVTFNGVQFRAITAHTSVVGWQPPNTPALWQPAP